mmetsp:Transcript_66108/g.123319  ORF Transcript_66108/g.123319 Transcript_66108/m.123319 type:complete len:370 (-) Transcript_66108:37-1146(-)
MQKEKMDAGRMLLSGALNGGGGGGRRAPAPADTPSVGRWSINQAFEVQPESCPYVEDCGVPPLRMDSVEMAIQYLNNGRAPCPGGLCYMQEHTNLAYYVLFRSDKENEAKELAGSIERHRRGGKWQEAWHAGYPTPAADALRRPPQRPPPQRPPPRAQGAPRPAAPPPQPSGVSPATGSRQPCNNGKEQPKDELVLERWTLMVDRWGSVETYTFPGDQEASALRKYAENKTKARVLFNPDGKEVDHGGLNPIALNKLRGAYQARRTDQLTIKCSNCGRAYEGEQRFCGHCGQQRPLAGICTCGTAFAPSSKFCATCGKERPVAKQWVPLDEITSSRRQTAKAARCECGQVFQADSTYCAQCGRRRPGAE